jgi:hypothetical protein
VRFTIDRRAHLPRFFAVDALHGGMQFFRSAPPRTVNFGVIGGSVNPARRCVLASSFAQGFGGAMPSGASMTLMTAGCPSVVPEVHVAVAPHCFNGPIPS